MGKTFNFKYLTESSPSLESMVTKDTIKETYLNTAIASLREMDALITQHTKKLYTQILEAESKSEENKMFAEYFAQFKDIFGKFANNIVGMRDRLIINIDNLIDSNSDLVDDDQYISDFTGTFSYSGWEFIKELDNPHFPHMNLREIYQKDFDYLGKIMQDKGINASPTERIKIIAQVCNEFSKHGKDGKYIKKLLKDLVDCDEHDSISECLYKSFRENKDFDIDKSSLYYHKENLINIDDYKNSITAMCDNLIADIQFIAEDIYSYLFRNEDNKLKIKTPTDGVIDRDYRLDTYAMNQVDIFMKSKVSQINKVLNVYVMALSIKIDAIMDCINQSKDILRTVKSNENIDAITTGDDGPIPADDSEVEDSPSDNDIDTNLSDDNTEEPESQENIPEDDNTESNEPDTKEVEDDNAETPASDNDENELPSEEPIDTNEEDNFELESFLLYDDDYLLESKVENFNSKISNYNADYFVEAELFESSMYELELMYEMYEMDNFVNVSILKEAGDAKPSAWVGIVRKLKALWDKFKDIVLVRSKDKIGYLKKNESFINKKVTIEGDFILKYTPDLSMLDKITIKPYDQVKKSLESENMCFRAMVSNVELKDGESISNALQRVILGNEQRAPLNNIKPNIKEAYNFCVNDYTNSIDSLKKMNAEIEKAQDRAIAAKKNSTNESFENYSIEDYFAEAQEAEPEKNNQTQKDDNGQENKTNSNKSEYSNFDVYFKTASKIIAAKMTIYQKLFNELYSFCKWHIKKAGGSSDGEESTSTENNNDSKENSDKVDLS